MSFKNNNSFHFSKKHFLLLFFLAVFIISSLNVYTTLSDYKAGSDLYSDIVSQVVISPNNTENITNSAYNSSETEPELYAQYNINFEALFEINPDVAAWLRFDQPEIISYPVIGGANSESYLKANIYGEYNSAGTLFMSKSNATDFSDKNTIIYGHNMKNSTMFGKLSNYTSSDFYESYPYFYIYTPDGKATKYQIFAADEISITDLDRYTINFGSTDAFMQYIDNAIQTAYYQTNTIVNENSSIVTLSTCTGTDSTRFIVQGVEVSSYIVD